MVLKITVKTLDSQNYELEAEDDWTVLQFKENIQGTVNVVSNEQRLIFCGRVLQDDKKLTEYDCNGKVIHLVRRPPPPPPIDSNQSSIDRARTDTAAPPQQNQGESNVLFSALTLMPEANMTQILRHILTLQQAIYARTSGEGTAGMSDIPRARIQFRTVRQQAPNPSDPNNTDASNNNNTQSNATTNIIDTPIIDVELTEVVTNIVGSLFRSPIFGGGGAQPNNQQPQHVSTGGQPTASQNNNQSGSLQMMDIDIDYDYETPQTAARTEPSVSQDTAPTASSSRSTTNPSVPQSTNSKLVDTMKSHPDWIPVIERDIQLMEQRLHNYSNRQHFFSDAYLSSIPKKRRRLLQANPETVSILQPAPSEAISNLLRRAITSSDSVPPSEYLEQILTTVSNDQRVQAAYEAYIKSVVEARLRYDYDYCPEKFENSSKYFK